MNMKRAKVWMLIGSVTLQAATIGQSHAEESPAIGGFFNQLANSSAQRVSNIGEETGNRLSHTGEAVAQHLEQNPEDVRHIDQIAELVAVDTLRTVESEVRHAVGGIAADTVRSVFSLFKSAENAE